MNWKLAFMLIVIIGGVLTGLAPLFLFTDFRADLGIGTMLLKSMLDQCKVMNYKKIFLEVRVSNEKAINFYEKFGFSKDAIRNNYYTDNSEDALLMSLSI